MLLRTSTRYSVEAAQLLLDGSEVTRLWVRNMPGLDAQSAQAKFGLGYVDYLAGACAVPLLGAGEAADATPIGHSTLGLHADTLCAVPER